MHVSSHLSTRTASPSLAASHIQFVRQKKKKSSWGATTSCPLIDRGRGWAVDENRCVYIAMIYLHR